MESGVYAPAHVGEAKIIIIDDEQLMRSLVADMLAAEGYEIMEYDPFAPAPELFKREWDVAIVDIIMPNLNGFAVYEEILRRSPLCQCIMITGYPDADKVNRSVDAGIFSFLVKPFSTSQMRSAVQGALKKKKLLTQTSGASPLHTCMDTLLTGESDYIRSVRAKLDELAPLDIPVLIRGESGTGKEVVARSIHRLSRRRHKTFMAINCAVLPASLIESELFGHARGAFTGASKTKFGFFEVADGGTLFLDEIGELSHDLQAKLLRVLDNGEFIRVGETQARQTDVRVISATNRDLDTMRREGKFRDDLFFRLRGSCVVLEPLRNRKEDIAPLVDLFMGADARLMPAARAALMEHDWPGNIRELRMVCASLKGRCKNGPMTDNAVREALGLSPIAGPVIQPYQELKSEVLRKFDREYFSAILDTADGNMTRAAQYADMDRKNLRQKIKVAGL